MGTDGLWVGAAGELGVVDVIEVVQFVELIVDVAHDSEALWNRLFSCWTPHVVLSYDGKEEGDIGHLTTHQFQL